MSDTAFETETGTPRRQTNTGSQEGFLPFPQLEAPKFGMPDGVREAATQWVDQNRKNFDAMIAAAEEACGACGTSWSTAAKGTADCAAKLAEAVHKNADAAFEFAHDLMAAKSLPDFIEISTTGARRQFETLTAQNRELWSLAQAAALDTMRPFKAAVPKVFQRPGTN